MDLERSILNKTNSTFKHNTASDDHLHPSASPSVDDAVLSHFRVEPSPMSSLPKPNEPRGESRWVNYSTHADDRLRAMAEVVSNPSYSHHLHYPPPLQTHTIGATAGTCYHHLPTPSPHDYNVLACIPSAPDAPSPAATPADEAVYGDGDMTEIDPEEDRRGAIPAALMAAGGRPSTTIQQEPGPVRCRFNELKLNPGSTTQFCDANNGSDPFLRKTVSHIFGRNKTCTQLIPKEQWIWFCRKHYQRFRYDVANWTLAQVDIVRHTLKQFKAWGKIKSFSVALRKREQNRKTSSSDRVDAPPTRRRTTPRVTASRAQFIRAKAYATATGQSMADVSQEPEVTSTGRRKSFPINVASPVPENLVKLLGDGKSFEQIEDILDVIEKNVKKEQENNKIEVLFPDIEILPVFEDDFLQDLSRTTGQFAENNSSRRRRSQNVRSSQLRDSSRISNAGHDVTYRPALSPPPTLSLVPPPAQIAMHPPYPAEFP